MGNMDHKSKQNDDNVLNHWISFADGFAMSPQEFYAALERELQARKVPGLAIAREEISEGGMLSYRREYLQLTRERLIFYICAAPFGTRFYFSCRTVYVPPVVTVVHALIVFLLLFGIWAGLNQIINFVYSGIILLFLVLLTVLAFRNVVALGLKDMDAMLLKIPAIGTIYERFFRKETYYRHDTRLMFLDTIPFVVQELAERFTGAKGIKLVRQYMRAPILGDLYKMLPPPQPQPEPEKEKDKKA